MFGINTSDDGGVELTENIVHDLNKYGKRNVTNQKELSPASLYSNVAYFFLFVYPETGFKH